MISYEQIQKVNEGLSGIDVKGKNYVMVPQRVKAFRQLFPEGFIRTELLSLENGVCVMQSKAGYYQDGQEIILGTGMAYEKETSSYINKTSFIENCETSSVGRCLGFLGLGIEGGGICSAEELANAINNQSKPKTEVKLPAPESDSKPFAPPKETAKAEVATIENAFKSCMEDFMAMFGISDSKEALKKFNSFRKSLQDGGVIPKHDKMLDAQEVADTFDAIYRNFKPSGDKA